MAADGERALGSQEGRERRGKKVKVKAKPRLRFTFLNDKKGRREIDRPCATKVRKSPARGF
jgi:hypothetical protein